MNNIILRKGDITQADTDAIVNAANSTMLGGGGVDGAIHRAAGKSLLEACKELKPLNGVRCPAGQARITHGGNLKAKYVIHAVGPRYGVDASPRNLLGNAYRNSLLLAKEAGCKSIAFPAISCGVYAYPLNEAAEIALQICRSDEFSGIEKYFYLFMDDVFDAWDQAFKKLAR